ncbi:MAG: divalent metal cation transporter [Wenzhouxiangella sp.]|jgi:Mn2+/Fe2+ NRAMP family transporter|nr:divalent metal cation transporter [Wenzhouxiangella sp.]
MLNRPGAKKLFAALGPGLLMAGAAIGVSHLVQATRAGAEYGLSLLGLVILACVLKYPFIEFGPRYAAATGESLIRGYQRLGDWALGLFALITLATMFIIQASVTLVTAGLAGLVFGIDATLTQLSFGVLMACIAVLAVGRFAALDGLMKIIIAALAISTTAAVVLAFGSPAENANLNPFTGFDQVWTAAGVAFVLALLGWMPIPLDVAAWHSLWTLERARQTGIHPSVGHALLDCRFGYLGATVTAAIFLLLGALVMHGSGESFPPQAVAFAGRLVDLYTASLGEWSRPVIEIAALTAMFSTTLAVTDAYPRVIRAMIEVSGAAREDRSGRQLDLHRGRYVTALLFVTIGALIIILYFGQRFTLLIDFATTVSFLAAPALAWLNIRVITADFMPEQHRPGVGMMRLAWTGFAFLLIFCLIWLGWRIF